MSRKKPLTNAEVFAYYRDLKYNDNDDSIKTFLEKYGDDQEDYVVFASQCKNPPKRNPDRYKWVSEEYGSVPLEESTPAGKNWPNQKWHLLVSYFGWTAVMKRPVGADEDWWKGRRFTYWRNAKCPELLLWMATAAGVRKGTIDAALKAATACCASGEELGEKLAQSNSEHAENIKHICLSASRKLAANVIKEIIPWEMVETRIEKQLNKCKANNCI